MTKLVILTTAILGLLFQSTFTASAFDRRTAVNAVNKIRVAHGLKKLRIHPNLQRAAREQSRIMAKTRRMKHTAARGYAFSTRLKRAGYRGLAAENIALGQKTLNRVLRAWMNSRGHRRNMLHPRMKYFGLAVAKGGGRNYWAMVLGG